MSGHASSNSSSGTSKSSASVNTEDHDRVRDMAAQIYISLVNGAIVVADDTAKIAANPEGLAKVSFKLAEAFNKVESESKANAKPKNQAFDVNTLDFDAWTTK